MNETIAGIYRAGAGAQPWNDALTAITAELGVKGCQMAAVSTSTGGILFSHVADDISGDAELDYVRKYHAADPRIPLLLGRSPGDWLYDQDAFDDDIAITNPYYRDLLIPYGSRYTASAKLLENAGEIVMIAFLARLGTAGFDERHRQLLSTFGFHLREAAALYQKTRSMLASSFAGAALLNRMTRPAFLLSADRSVTHMNDVGRAALSTRRHLVLQRDRLMASDAESELRLKVAFDALLDRLSTDGSRRPIVRLGGGTPSASVAV